MSKHRTVSSLAILAVGALALAATTGARADDRDLLRDSVGRPYVFILLDVSGSMNWAARCTAEQMQPKVDAAGNVVGPPDCDYLCPTGDCFVSRQADDPSAKFFQAKEALYAVLKDVQDVQFGFATYNQDHLRVTAKHWIYQAGAGGVDIPGFGPFPAAGSEEVFGQLWSCDNGATAAEETGCYPNRAANLTDPWDLTRVRRLPKGGDGFNQPQTFYVANAQGVFRVTYTPTGGALPDPTLTLQVTVARCRDFRCQNRDAVGQASVPFTLVDDFLSWEFQVSRNEPKLGYFNQGAATDSRATNTCAGWDPNTDTGLDEFAGVDLRFPSTFGAAAEPRRTLFSEGDVVPLSWTSNNRDKVLQRLAPNTALDPTAPPDFAIADFFDDHPRPGSTVLDLLNPGARPLIPNGSTPLGNSIRSFRTWWAGCPQGACARDTGWSDIAAAEDPDWGCRRKFLLVITDGDDTCPGADACAGTAALFAQEGIKTFVVAFGVQNTPGNRLTCMAANGGTGEPVFPQNKQQLVDALNNILGEIRQEARSFASAAVPSVQAEVSDKIYLSNFTPLNARSVWDGHIDAYLKPLPLTADNRPDAARQCPGNPDDASCHLWDAGEILLGQAPTPNEILSGNDRLGPATDQRRIFYGTRNLIGGVPTDLAPFAPPANTAPLPLWLDLAEGLGVPIVDPLNPGGERLRVQRIVEQTLVRKSATVTLPNGTSQTISYVLGDIFHSNPVVLDKPGNFTYYAADLGSDGTACTDGNPGYRCYADELRFRRKLLVVGANDGQLHFFDAGIFDPNVPASPLSSQTGRFDNGSGTELFSFIPRRVLPAVREQAEGSSEIFSVDGSARIDDVFIDPLHNGTPTPGDRRWRTVAIGGLREGGSVDRGGRLQDLVSGYYALDVTRPDAPSPTKAPIIPTCLDVTNPTVPRCDTVPFPAELWEFVDEDANLGGQRDEDLNGRPDLGDTWSNPTVGRIRVCTSLSCDPADPNARFEDRFVAIFGGGFDPESKNLPRRGNFLYMVDVETGEVLYKRRLDSDTRPAAVPSDPAVIDRNLDGYLDFVYIGTTAGLLWKVDISQPAPLTTRTVTVGLDASGLPVTSSVTRIADGAWRPFPLFDTGGRPIYFPPTVLFVGELNQVALAFGVGDREDLWSFTGQEGRFYMVVDEDFTRAQLLTGTLPLDESQFQIFAADAAAAGGDAVLSPQTGFRRGWVVTLDRDERVIAPAFGLAGVVVFSTFKPQVVTLAPGSSNPPGQGAVCARTGDSRVFVVFANNADPVMTVDGQKSRSRVIPDFTTPPFVQQGQTRNTATGQKHAEQLTDLQKEILETVKQLFPKGTKFGNYWFSVDAIRSDTGFESYAKIPVGIRTRNWKEF